MTNDALTLRDDSFGIREFVIWICVISVYYCKKCRLDAMQGRLKSRVDRSRRPLLRKGWIAEIGRSFKRVESHALPRPDRVADFSRPARRNARHELESEQEPRVA
jgi:hypothetical protein